MTNQKKTKNNNKYFCIFGGGGIRGITYVGAIKALDELGIKVFVSDDGDIVKCSYLYDEDGNPREMMLDDVLE